MSAIEELEAELDEHLAVCYTCELFANTLAAGDENAGDPPCSDGKNILDRIAALEGNCCEDGCE